MYPFRERVDRFGKWVDRLGERGRGYKYNIVIHQIYVRLNYSTIKYIIDFIVCSFISTMSVMVYHAQFYNLK